MLTPQTVRFPLSHHFDTALAKRDPRLNVADMYLFDGGKGRTVMVMTANADAGISAPDTLHPEGLYAFRVHRSSSVVEDLVFKFRFGAPDHADGDEHRHVQRYDVIRAEKNEIGGKSGDVILSGSTGAVEAQGEVKAFVGLVPELWAADAIGFRAFMTAIYRDERFDLSAWGKNRNYFERRNVSAIVLEVPNSMIGEGLVHVWASISLFGHAPEVQVSRWGIPLFSHLFLTKPNDTTQVERYHVTHPRDDRTFFAPVVQPVVARLARLAGTASDPELYGQRIAERITPTMLPYELGTPAVFGKAKFNGRRLEEDVLDVMFSLAADVDVSDGTAPDATRLIDRFPYYGAPFSQEEQRGLVPFAEHGGLAI